MSDRVCLLPIVNVLPIWTIRHEHGNLFFGLGTVNVASHDAIEALQLDGDILLQYVRERSRIDDKKVVSNLVWHVAVAVILARNAILKRRSGRLTIKSWILISSSSNGVRS